MFDLRTIIPIIANDLPTIMCLRHAEKTPLAGCIADELRDLTTAGQNDTRLFANWLAAANIVIDKIFTSPVLRCQKTAELLQQEGKTKLYTSNLLGAPGVYVKTPALAEKVFTQYPVETVVQKLLRQEKLPGFYDLSTASAKLLDQMISDIGAMNQAITLFYVTHDTILQPFLYYLIEKTDVPIGWFEYLQGFVIQFVDSKTLNIYLSDKLRILKSI